MYSYPYAYYWGPAPIPARPYPVPSLSRSEAAPAASAELLRDIEKAINGEAEAVAYYAKLIELAPDEEDKAIIGHIREEEVEHLQKFTAIYVRLTGRQPVIETGKLPSTFLEGVRASIKDELETNDFYQGIATKTTDPVIIQSFMRASFDEQRHATWFLYMWNKALG